MRLLLLRLGRFLARAGERMQAAALRGAGIVPVRKPPQRAPQASEPIAVPGPIETPTAIKPRAWRLPTPEEIDRGRGECAAHCLPQLKICRGPGKGCARRWNEQASCPDCYIVQWHDQRPSAEIVAAMERGDA